MHQWALRNTAIAVPYRFYCCSSQSAAVIAPFVAEMGDGRWEKGQRGYYGTTVRGITGNRSSCRGDGGTAVVLPVVVSPVKEVRVVYYNNR